MFVDIQKGGLPSHDFRKLEGVEHMEAWVLLMVCQTNGSKGIRALVEFPKESRNAPVLGLVPREMGLDPCDAPDTGDRALNIDPKVSMRARRA